MSNAAPRAFRSVDLTARFRRQRQYRRDELEQRGLVVDHPPRQQLPPGRVDHDAMVRPLAESIPALTALISDPHVAVTRVFSAT
jgi:hypothetical protein